MNFWSCYIIHDSCIRTSRISSSFIQSRLKTRNWRVVSFQMCKFCCVFFSLFSSENFQIMRIVVKTVRTSEIYSWTVWKHTSPCPAQCCKALKSNEQYHWGLHCCRLHCNHSKCITMTFTNASVHLIWLLNRINRQYFFFDPSESWPL